MPPDQTLATYPIPTLPTEEEIRTFLTHENQYREAVALFQSYTPCERADWLRRICGDGGEGSGFSSAPPYPSGRGYVMPRQWELEPVPSSSSSSKAATIGMWVGIAIVVVVVIVGMAIFMHRRYKKYKRKHLEYGEGMAEKFRSKTFGVPPPAPIVLPDPTHTTDRDDVDVDSDSENYDMNQYAAEIQEISARQARREHERRMRDMSDPSNPTHQLYSSSPRASQNDTQLLSYDATSAPANEHSRIWDPSDSKGGFLDSIHGMVSTIVSPTQNTDSGVQDGAIPKMATAEASGTHHTGSTHSGAYTKDPGVGLTPLIPSRADQGPMSVSHKGTSLDSSAPPQATSRKPSVVRPKKPPSLLRKVTKDISELLSLQGNVHVVKADAPDGRLDALLKDLQTIQEKGKPTYRLDDTQEKEFPAIIRRILIRKGNKWKPSGV